MLFENLISYQNGGSGLYFHGETGVEMTVLMKIYNLTSYDNGRYGLDGRMILSEELGTMKKGSQSHTLSLDNLDDGLYILELNVGLKLYKEKFFISR